MRCKVLFRGKSAQIRSIFTPYHLHGLYPDAVDGSQVYSAHPKTCLAHLLFPVSADPLRFFADSLAPPLAGLSTPAFPFAPVGAGSLCRIRGFALLSPRTSLHSAAG